MTVSVNIVRASAEITGNCGTFVSDSFFKFGVEHHRSICLFPVQGPLMEEI
jgi:hypothetical protein